MESPYIKEIKMLSRRRIADEKKKKEQKEKKQLNNPNGNESHEENIKKNGPGRPRKPESR